MAQDFSDLREALPRASRTIKPAPTIFEEGGRVVQLRYNIYINDKPEATFQGTFGDNPAIFKFGVGDAEESHQLPIMTHLRREIKRIHLEDTTSLHNLSYKDALKSFPKPFGRIPFDQDYLTVTLSDGTLINLEQVTYLVIYSCIEGRDATVETDLLPANSTLIADVEDHLDRIHKAGIIHGDAWIGNVIWAPEVPIRRYTGLTKGRYLLIDYGNSWSIDGTTFPDQRFGSITIDGDYVIFHKNISAQLLLRYRSIEADYNKLLCASK